MDIEIKEIEKVPGFGEIILIGTTKDGLYADCEYIPIGEEANRAYFERAIRTRFDVHAQKLSGFR